MGREKKRGSPQQVEETRRERPNSSNLDVRLRHKWLGKKSSPKESKGEKRSGAQGAIFYVRRAFSPGTRYASVPGENEGIGEDA